MNKQCPFCKIEMIRPRADMKTSGTEKWKLEGSDYEYDVLSNNVPIGDAPLISFSDANKTVMKYYDYMCPKCNLVLFYGEIIFNGDK